MKFYTDIYHWLYCKRHFFKKNNKGVVEGPTKWNLYQTVMGKLTRYRIVMYKETQLQVCYRLTAGKDNVVSAIRKFVASQTILDIV